MAELHDSQTNILIQDTSFFNKVRVMIRHAWALREEESPLYMLYSHILTAFCETAGDPLDVDRALGCEPQSSFSAPPGTDFDRRIPDFTVMVAFLQDLAVVNRFSPSYRSPVLGFWVEVKPLNCDAIWISDEAQREAQRAVWLHLEQLNLQGLFAFSHFAGDTFYCMLVLGIYFSVFKYSRPAHLPHPTHPRHPSVSHLSHPDSSQGQKRPKRKRSHDVTSHKAQTNAKQAMERKVLSRSIDTPTTLYYCEPIVIEDGKAFNPLFQKALWDIATSRDIDIPFQPSFFTPPPGDYHASEASLEMAYQDFDQFDRDNEQKEQFIRDAIDSDSSTGEDTSGNYYSSARPSDSGATRRTRSQSRDDALSEADLDALDDTDDTNDNTHSNIEDAIPLDFDFNLDRDVNDGGDGNNNNNDDGDDDDDDDEEEGNMWQYPRGRLARGRESRH
ncbi:hypothetical protein SCP_1202850 [Sparassis crispa]|uniref:Uncharacterized protein n=1 Tax=Sparassis crispa TaxID=139825 RepID=A0A401H0U9_9APHY|nr:hypothetical protein SCP_1202850 [Sparassis crispa]GBE88056.1 hypothetical protein SCP_1202850 [Sparassis crispa]